MGECTACIYFKRHNDIGGLCYRYPPLVVTEIYQNVSVQSQLTNQRPYVENKEYCGEFRDEQ